MEVGPGIWNLEIQNIAKQTCIILQRSLSEHWQVMNWIPFQILQMHNWLYQDLDLVSVFQLIQVVHETAA